MKEKKKVLLILGVLIAVISVVGISYAVWQLSLIQTDTNVVTSGCFKVEFTDQNPIQLTNAYPITNEEGKTLTPYEFTITNTCDSEASYQVNLEILNDSTLTELGYIREMLNEQGSTSNSKILTKNKEVEKTLENASSAYKLKQGVLGAKESKTFEFRLWMDQDTPAIPSVMNKELNSKITVITSYKAPIDTTNMMVAMDVDVNTTGDNKTYIQKDKYRSTLKKVIFENKKEPIADSLEVVDFSVNQDESVLGYYVGNADQTEVELHIQANGKIKVNTNGSYYFYTGMGASMYPAYTFEGFENLDTSEVTNMMYMFMGRAELTSLDVSHFDTSKVTKMVDMFQDCSSLTSLDISNFDTSNVTDMGGMFSGMSGLTGLDLSTFDTFNVTDMSGMFSGMSGLTSIDLSPLDTSNVTSMSYMFSEMSGLTSIDLSPLDTSNVTNMEAMFSGMSGLTSIDLSPLDTSNVTSMSYMFREMSGLTSIDLSPLDTSNVTNMYRMFSGMSGLTSIDLSPLDTSNVTSMSYMFSGMSSLTTIIYGDRFIHNENTDTYGMFTDCPANKPTHSSWSSVTW